jgi:hypothetical protein
MAYYNEYQKMHYFALYGNKKPKGTPKPLEANTAPKQPKKAQLYNLLYRGKIVHRNSPYAACETKRRVLNASNPANWGWIHFTFEKVKQTPKN